MQSGLGDHHDDPDVQRAWPCQVCQKSVFRIAGIAAAFTDGQVRFWIAGYCRAHDEQVWGAIDQEAHDHGEAELMVRETLLRPQDVIAWMRRLHRELTTPVA